MCGNIFDSCNHHYKFAMSSGYIIPAKIIPIMKVTLAECPQSIEMITVLTGLDPFQIMIQLDFADFNGAVGEEIINIYDVRLIKRIIDMPNLTVSQFNNIAHRYPRALTEEIIDIFDETITINTKNTLLLHSSMIAKKILAINCNETAKIKMLNVLFDD